MNFNTVSSRTVITLIIVGVVLVGGGLLLSTALPLIVPPEGSAEAQQVDNLFRIMLVIGGAIFLMVQGLLAYSVWRFRARPGDASDGPHIHGNTTLEIVWTAVPAVIVVVLTILSFSVWQNLQAAKPNEMVVNVRAARFAWSFTYDVPNPRDNTQTLAVNTNELHVYAGQPVVLRMQTIDVIHALWIPAFRIKQDVLPGRTTEVRFTPVETGGQYPVSYPLKCAELCGSGHGDMVTKVWVHRDEAEYLAWLNPEIDRVLNPPADPVVRGRDILASQIFTCHTCHTLPDLGWTATVGPNLNGVGDRAAGPRLAATGLGSARDYLIQSVHEPSLYLVPGFGALMPQFDMTNEQLLSIVAYLCTQTASGDPACTVAPEEIGAAPAAEATAEATLQIVPGEPTAEAALPILSGEATAEATLAIVPGAEAATAEPTVAIVAPAGEATTEATAAGS